MVDEPISPGPNDHQLLRFGSPRVAPGGILESFFPLAQSTAIKPQQARRSNFTATLIGTGGDTFTVTKAQSKAEISRKGSTGDESLQLLNLNSLPSLCNNSKEGAYDPSLLREKDDESDKENGLCDRSECRKTQSNVSVEEEEANSHAVQFNADELRNLEEALGNLSGEEPEQTTGQDRIHKCATLTTDTNSIAVRFSSAEEEENPDATYVSSIPSLSFSDTPNGESSLPRLNRPLKALHFDDYQSQPFGDLTNIQTSRDTKEPSIVDSNKFEISSETSQSDSQSEDRATSCLLDRVYERVYFTRPLSTIIECRSRESISALTSHRTGTCDHSEVEMKANGSKTGDFTGKVAAQVSTSDLQPTSVPKIIQPPISTPRSTRLPMQRTTSVLSSDKSPVPASVDCFNTPASPERHSHVYDATVASIESPQGDMSSLLRLSAGQELKVEPQFRLVAEPALSWPRQRQSIDGEEPISRLHTSDIDEMLASGISELDCSSQGISSNSRPIDERLKPEVILRKRILRRRNGENKIISAKSAPLSPEMLNIEVSAPHMLQFDLPSSSSTEYPLYVKVKLSARPNCGDCCLDGVCLRLDTVLKNSGGEGNCDPLTTFLVSVAEPRLVLLNGNLFTQEEQVFPFKLTVKPLIQLSSGMLMELHVFPLLFKWRSDGTAHTLIAATPYAIRLGSPCLIEKEQNGEADCKRLPMGSEEKDHEAVDIVISEMQAPQNQRESPPLHTNLSCLFWRGAAFGESSIQHFVLHHSMSGLAKISVKVVAGADVFTLLDERGQPSHLPRILQLPPRLKCTLGVIFNPQPPNHWHSGVLSVKIISPQPIGARMHLFGYTTKRNLEISCCQRLDSETHWTSAFPFTIFSTSPASTFYQSQIEGGDNSSEHQHLSLPRQQQAAHIARVLVNNRGMRTAWIRALAFPLETPVFKALPDSDAIIAVKPDRFRLPPNQSQNVTIICTGECQLCQVNFYNGDEVIRHFVRKSYNPDHDEVKITRPHQRLRTAQILQFPDEDCPSISDECPPIGLMSTFRAEHWRQALRGEQKETQPLTLTVYALSSSGRDSSFESSAAVSNDTATNCLEVSSTTVNATGIDASGRLLLTSPVHPFSTSPDSALRPRDGPSRHCPRQHSGYPAVGRWVDEIAVINSSCLPEESFVPIITLLPLSELPFAPCPTSSSTIATFEVALTSESDKLCVWRVHWMATPLKKTASFSPRRHEGGSDALLPHEVATASAPNVFACHLGTRILASDKSCGKLLLTCVPPSTEVGSGGVCGTKFHVPFIFRPIASLGAGTYNQQWTFAFHLSSLSETRAAVINAVPSCEHAGEDQSPFKASQTFVVNLCGEAIDPIRQSVLHNRPNIPGELDQSSQLRIVGGPINFSCAQSSSIQKVSLLNLSRDHVLRVFFGGLDRPFYIVRPKVSKFKINPRCSIYLEVEFRPEQTSETFFETTLEINYMKALSHNESRQQSPEFWTKRLPIKAQC